MAVYFNKIWGNPNEEIDSAQPVKISGKSAPNDPMEGGKVYIHFSY